MTWSAEIVGQLEFYWDAHLWPRLQGLGDDEYLWEPATPAWSLRPDADGRWVLDDLPLAPPLPPVTTIAWRLVHIGRDVMGKRARALFAPDTLPAGTVVPDDAIMYDDCFWPEPMPATGAGALEFLARAYALWRDGVAALDDEAMRRPIGPRGGQYADQSLASLALHVNREVMAHGGEICLLRDLYRARSDAADPVVAAALAGDAATVRSLLRAPEAPAARPTLVVEAAGLQHWDVVSALIENGAAADAGTPGALHYAAGAGHVDTVRALLAHGADPTATDPQWGLTPEGWARFFDRTEAADVLASADHERQ